MKRAGFTMIELIFVIVILGILAAVALPRFIGVSEQAQAGKCDAFVGTLNRTVGPALWSESIANGGNGFINATTANGGAARTAEQINDAIEGQIDFPDECIANIGGAATDAYASNHTVVVGDNTYDVNFTDGTLNRAPVWAWERQP